VQYTNIHLLSENDDDKYHTSENTRRKTSTT